MSETFTHTDQLQKHTKKDRPEIVVLGGAFSTGKSTLLHALEQNFGERYRYIRDGAREIIQDYTNGGDTVEECSISTLQQIQRDVMEYYLRAEAAHDGRITISDGSLVEVAAYSQHVLDSRDFLTLNSLMRYRDMKDIYKYVKFPINCTPITYDGVRHTDEDLQFLIDKRIDSILALNHFKTLRLPSAMLDFRDRYKRVTKFIRSIDKQ